MKLVKRILFEGLDVWYDSTTAKSPVPDDSNPMAYHESVRDLKRRDADWIQDILATRAVLFELSQAAVWPSLFQSFKVYQPSEKRADREYEFNPDYSIGAPAEYYWVECNDIAVYGFLYPKVEGFGTFFGSKQKEEEINRVSLGWLTSAFISPKDKDRWYFSCELVVGIEGHKPIHAAEFAFSTDLQGKVRQSHRVKIAVVDHRFPFYDQMSWQLLQPITDLVDAFYGYLSMRNITTLDRPCDPLTAKKRRRSGGYTYKVLALRPTRQASTSATPIPLDQLPLHRVRGHRKRYGAQWGTKPLFGKYEGDFYWHPHARGDEKHGVVDKDYEVRGE
jgi:hypothetical protein